jgi:hypothetical protein
MSIEQGLRKRIEQLVQEGSSLARGDPEWGNCRNAEHASECGAWTTAATHAVCLVCPSPHNTYHQAAVKFETTPRDYSINDRVGEFTGLLKRLLADVDDGLLASVANQARGETLDDLLDQAAEYLKQERLDGSGILAGSIFEDTLRRICRSNGIDDKSAKTDNLISDLNKREIISNNVAKRCRAAAGLRNSALHAQWDEFTIGDVQATVLLARELIAAHLA